MARLRLVDAGAPTSPEVPAIEYTPQDEEATLCSALVAVRRAADCRGVPLPTRHLLRATADLLETLQKGR